MKTKNIFRMLLVAAALLMGANNVKADITLPYSDPNAQNYNYLWIAYGELDDAKVGDKLVVTYNPGTGGGYAINFNGTSISVNDSGSADIYFTATMISSINKTNESNGCAYIQGTNVAITGIVLVTSGGSSTSTTDEPAWSYSGEGDGQWLNNWNPYNLPSGTFNSLKCDGTDVIRVYGKLGNLGTTPDGSETILYGIELVADWNDSAKKIKHTGTDNFAAGYYDFTNVSSTLANALKSTGIINGYNFYVSSIVINPTMDNSSISFSNNVELTFGDIFTPPTVTTSPSDATVIYTSSDTNVAYISNNTVIPVGAGTATITGTIQGTNVSNTYTITVNAPTRTGAAWTGAAWLGSYGREEYGGGTQPTISTSNLQTAKIGDIIRFYGKLGPLDVDHNTEDYIWRVEIHDANSWAELADINSADSNNSTDNANFEKGYFDMVIDNINISKLNSAANLRLNGHNLTITAVELIDAAKQDVTLQFRYTTATATMGQAFNPPILSAYVNNQVVTGLNIIYSSSNTGVASVNPSTGSVTLVGPGTTIISASFGGNDDYNPAVPVSYSLTVSAAAPQENDYINVADGKIEVYGYRTYVTTETVDFSHSIGVEGYYATGLNTSGNAVEFTQVVGTCPANVPLLLKAKEDATEYKLLKSSATATAPTGNKLVAGTGSTVQGDNKYVLTVHSENVVFAEVNINGANVDTSHAYLDLSGSNARGRLIIKLNGESTGISSLQSDERSLDGTVYNLRGQRVEHPTKGIYIINGKKIVIK